MTAGPAVDVHTHFAPPRVLAAARRGQGFDGMTAERTGGTEWLVHRQGFRWPVPPVFYDLTARLASMDGRGIGHAVLSVAPQLFMYWADGGEAAGFCREVNDELAAFAAGSGGRITALATLPMQDPGAAVAELRRAVTELGMRGAEIGPDVAGTPLDDPGPRAVPAGGSVARHRPVRGRHRADRRPQRRRPFRPASASTRLVIMGIRSCPRPDPHDHERCGPEEPEAGPDARSTNVCGCAGRVRPGAAMVRAW